MMIVVVPILFGGFKKVPIDILNQALRLVVQNGNGGTQSDVSASSVEYECSIYMALSSIPNAGFGV